MSTFLQSSYNARSAENTSSIISPGNSTQTALGAPNGSYTGAWVPSAFYSVLQITAKSDSLIQILVEQSFLGVVADQVSDAFYNTQEDINILRAVPFYAYITLPFMRILVNNIDTIENTIFELATKLTSTPPPQNLHVIVDSGTVTVTGTVQTQDLPLENIAGVLASKPVGSMIINNWYRVASAGNTSGAVWIEIGAYINPGESAPRIGALFKCVYVYGDTSPAAGAVWDEPYNTWNADNLTVVSTNLKVVETNSAAIKTAVETINTNVVLCDTDNVVIESGSISVDNFPSTQPISGSVSIIEPLPEGTNTLGNVNAYAYNLQQEQFTALTIETDSNLKVVEKNSTDILTAADSIDSKITACDTNNVTISAALPYGTNSIGAVQGTAYNITEGLWQPIILTNDNEVQVLETNSSDIAASLVSIDNNITSTLSPNNVGGNAVNSFIWAYNAATGTLNGLQSDAALNLKVVETNSADILAATDSIDAKITACDTGAVVISSGSVEISNFPATQPISGSVSISGTVTEINSADILAATDSIDAKITACNTGAVVISSGSVSVSNFPATQPISGSVSISGIPTVDETNSSAILTKTTSIDNKITACNTGAVVVSSGTINTQSSGNASSQASVPTVPVTAGVKWNSPSSPMANYSMIQVAIKASATSITTEMTFMVEYSPNNTDWFPSDDVLSFTNGGPLNIILPGAKFTAMPYVRVSYDPPALSTDTASNVVVYFLKKSA